MNKGHKMQPVRGLRDISGKQMQAFNQVLKCAHNLAHLYNYDELTLPMFEFSEIFHRTLGESSDIISKETYTFLDRDKDSITLRPEFTASVVRSVISNGLTQTLPIKYFSHGAVFRHERPQKARYRQFHQLNFEYIGVAEPYSDIELILLALNLFKKLDLDKEVTLELSSIGDVESRNNYKIKLIKYLSKYESSLSEDSKVRLKQNPLRILDSKDEQDHKILQGAPKIYDSFTKTASERFEQVKKGLSDVEIDFTINAKLVRGLDYYTHTVFEFTTDKLGSQGTLLAGGRYDGLFELMGGPSISAVGFASGIERLGELIMDKLVETSKRLVFLVPIGSQALEKSPIIANKLREQGLAVDWVYNSNIVKQMQKANKMKATHALIFGDAELANNVLKLKNMSTGKESEANLDNLGNLANLLD